MPGTRLVVPANMVRQLPAGFNVKIVEASVSCYATRPIGTYAIPTFPICLTWPPSEMPALSITITDLFICIALISVQANR
jgi:hypothetical protein